MTTESRTCGARIDGPKMPGMGGAVAWRRYCQRTVRVEPGTFSARCWQHR